MIYFAWIMANCKSFSNSQLVFIKRDGNKVAHQLVIIVFDSGLGWRGALLITGFNFFDVQIYCDEQ